MASTQLALEVQERLRVVAHILDDFDEAIKFQARHEEAKAHFPGEIQKLAQERDALKASIASLEETFQKEKVSNQRARFAQKTADDNQQKEIKLEIESLLERKSELKKSHEIRMKATEKEYEGLIAGKRAERTLEEEALQTARNDREEYKRRAASW
ncbi:hypothetical protein LCGC14_1810320 [marine sediment metagenome]|uniref:Uncharacterized protein n=1 Tax=marine sediment metagenome TaxID=412755 RepID=A0A0F9JLP5_9ZZZZ